MARKLCVGILLVVTLAVGSVPLTGSPVAKADASDNVVLQWDQVALQAIRDTRPLPGPAARALAVVHTAIYDAWAAYDPVAVGTRLLGSLRRPAAEQTLANKTKAISFAAYAALVDLFPTQQAALDQQMAALGYATDGSDTSTAASVGTAAAQAVLDFRHNDGSNQAGNYADGCVPACYQPVNTPDAILDPNRWQPLRLPNSTVQTFATPHWRNVTPFALTSAAQFRPEHGPAMAVVKSKPNSDYLKQVDQQLKYSANLTDTQ